MEIVKQCPISIILWDLGGRALKDRDTLIWGLARLAKAISVAWLEEADAHDLQALEELNIERRGRHK